MSQPQNVATGIRMDGAPVPVALLNGWFFTAFAKGAMRGTPPFQNTNFGSPGGFIQSMAQYVAALRDTVPLADGYLTPLDLFPDPNNGSDAGVAVIVLNSLSTPLTLLGMYKDDGMVDAGASQSSYPAIVYPSGETKFPHAIPGIHGYPTPSAHPLVTASFGSDLMAGVGIYRFHCPTNSISVDKDLGMGFAMGFSCNAEGYPDVGLAFKKARQFYDTATWADGGHGAGLISYQDPKDSWQPTNINISSHTWSMGSKVSADISKVTGLLDPKNPNATLATGVNINDQLKKLHSRLNNRWMQGTATGAGGTPVIAYEPIGNYPNAAESNFSDFVQLPDGNTLFIWGTITPSAAQPSMNVITIWVGDTKSWLNDIQGEMPGYHWGNTPRRIDQPVPLLVQAEFGSGGKKIGVYVRTGTNKWKEAHYDGPFTASFDEVSSDKSSIYLRDTSRHVYIHFDLGRSKIRYSDAGTAEYDLYDILAVRQIPL